MKYTPTALLALFIICCISCAPTLDLVFEGDATGPPITLRAIDPPDTVNTEGTSIEIEYSWNRSRQAFESRQNAKGEINYIFFSGMFGGGRHAFPDWPASMGKIMKYSGTLRPYARNKFGDGYATGEGRLMYGITCTYKGKDGKKHKGSVSNYLQIPVTFVK